MTTLVQGQTLKTRESGINVDPTFKPGLHRFRLVVVDNDGNESGPDELVIEVRTMDTIPIRGAPPAAKRARARRRPQ
jgi:hypothetical protein